MSEIASILAELQDIHDGDAWHGASLQAAVTGLTAAQAAATPLANAHSVWEIVAHIAGWENIWRRRLAGEGQATEPEAGDFPPVQAASQEAWAQALAYLASEHTKLLRVIAELPDEALAANVAQRDYTVRFLLRGIVRHHVYHAGQIALLRKALVAS